MFKTSLEELLSGATNVYRTKKYIVKQCMGMEYHEELDNAFCSQDTFIKRNKARFCIFSWIIKFKYIRCYTI